ncbi:hypothetical protein N8703_00075 [Verrucomicrobia bacterium]|jgi:hypothetical protein|nr:hypothetical protein [Verrucomicrobiota bacterium]
MVPEVPKHTLEDFIAEEMSMSHIYQPAMLKVILAKKTPSLCVLHRVVKSGK